MKLLNNNLGIPYWLGAIFLGILNTAVFWVSSKPWGVTAAMSYWGAFLAKLFGATPQHWIYFAQLQLQNELGEYQPLFHGTVLNIGIILGSFFAAYIYKEFRVRKPRSSKQLASVFVGGLLMGYGARLAGGCSLGALVSGTASLSLHGWIFGLFLFPGVWLGLKLSQKILY